MPATDADPPSADPADAPLELVEVGAYSTPVDGFAHGLVVLAMGAPYWLEPGPAGFRLLVETRVGHAARAQLASFDRESRDWPPAAPELHATARKGEFSTPLLWSLVVLAVFWLQTRQPELTDAGALDPEAVFGRGEWWRLGTALFLHADVGHVVTNGICGIFIFAAVLSAFGRWRGWLALAAAAIAGNLFAALARQHSGYRSIGASTAIFAGLGLLTGRAIRIALRSDHPHRVRLILIPLAAGLAVLGLYGAGGMQVDVLAHATGFAAGLLLGFASADAANVAPRS
ncbi:MAG TPA: rhomboid family intramembrane serine protease [Opitutaceae bacterium]|nr:rhomboid family intramembrane serine protease [Opitutaceae bacterium]